jgi:hypothetical protein
MPARWAGFAAQLLGGARAPRFPGYASFGFHQVCERGSNSRPSVFALCRASFREAVRALCFHVAVRFEAGNLRFFLALFVSQYVDAQLTRRRRLARVVPGHAGSRSRPVCFSRVCERV